MEHTPKEISLKKRSKKWEDEILKEFNSTPTEELATQKQPEMISNGISLSPKEEEILEAWLKKHSNDGQYIDGGNNYEEYCLDGYFNLQELVSSIRREAIAERDEEIKNIVKNIPTRCRICEKTGVNCYGECECSYEDKGYIKKTDVLSHLTQE